MKVPPTDEGVSDDASDDAATESDSGQTAQPPEVDTKEDPNAIAQDAGDLVALAEGWDDTDYIPDFIEDFLADPPILPNEDSGAFEQLFESFERACWPKTDFEFILVFELALAAWELIRYRRLKVAIIAKERPGAVKALHRRFASESVAHAECDQSKPAARTDPIRYFVDPEYRSDFIRSLEDRGFGKNAVEAEAFSRSLIPLSTIERLIKSAEKRFTQCQRKLEASCGARDREQPMPLSMAARRAEDRRRKRNGIG